MAVTTLPAPAQTQASSILDFLLQMSSIEERKKYRKTQEKYASLAERELGLAEKGWEAGKPIREEAAVTAKGRTKVKESLLLTERKLADIRRELHKAIAYGDRDTADASRFLIKKLEREKKNAPIMTEWAFFAEEKGKEQTAENQLLRQQVFSAGQESKAYSAMFNMYKMQTGAMLDGIKSMSDLATASGVNLTGESIDAALAGDSATEIAKLMAPGVVGEAAAKLGAARQKPWPDPADFTPRQRAAWDPQSLSAYKDAFRNTGRGIETMTLPKPRTVWGMIWGDSAELTVTRKRAVEMNLEKEYDAVKRGEAAKVQPKDKNIMPGSYGLSPFGAPGTVKRKTVKELADEKAKETKGRGKPAGKETKSPYPQYPDAFLEDGVWKVIVEGVKYRIED